jgi:hypothetical protein
MEKKNCNRKAADRTRVLMSIETVAHSSFRGGDEEFLTVMHEMLQLMLKHAGEEGIVGSFTLDTSTKEGLHKKAYRKRAYLG